MKELKDIEIKKIGTYLLEYKKILKISEINNVLDPIEQDYLKFKIQDVSKYIVILSKMLLEGEKNE